MNNAVFEKTMENVTTQRYQTCHNRKKKKLFTIQQSFSQKNY